MVEDRGIGRSELSFMSAASSRLGSATGEDLFRSSRYTHTCESFRDDAHAALVATLRPECDWRVFFTTTAQGQDRSSGQAITDFRLHKDAAKSTGLLKSFSFVRAFSKISTPIPKRRGITSRSQHQRSAGRTASLHIRTRKHLADRPETPDPLGIGRTSMYRDIATLDQGPDILRNSFADSQYDAAGFAVLQEEQHAEPYFHRGRAAELLALLDEKYPNALRRPECTPSCTVLFPTREVRRSHQRRRDFSQFPEANNERPHPC